MPQIPRQPKLFADAILDLLAVATLGNEAGFIGGGEGGTLAVSSRLPWRPSTVPARVCSSIVS